MTRLEGEGGGAPGKLWRKHGGGYYALLAVGTFAYLEIQSIAESIAESAGVGDFIRSEVVEKIVLLGLETLLNSILASIWPFLWARWMGLGPAATWATGGYVIWALLLAWLLARRERAYRKELGL